MEFRVSVTPSLSSLHPAVETSGLCKQILISSEILEGFNEGNWADE